MDASLRDRFHKVKGSYLFIWFNLIWSQRTRGGTMQRMNL